MTPTREENHAISCHGKIKHKTRASAINARDCMLRRPNRRKIEKSTLRPIRLGAYLCSACHFYHLGHNSK